MPSDKKRINLTVPDAIYERLQVYKSKYGITNDASACLQLIVQQLNGQETSEAILKLAQSASLDQLTAMSKEGLSYLKSELEQSLPASALKDGR